MNYATIKPRDIANGPGVRVSLFVSGCTHRCPGCFNEEAWDFDYGQPFDQSTIDEILGLLQPDYVQGLTLLGGEPCDPRNQVPSWSCCGRSRQNIPIRASGPSPATSLTGISCRVGWAKAPLSGNI